MTTTTYSYETALAESIKYFNGDELAAKVFVDKYALRNNKKELLELTPADMHKRIARELARVERNKFAKPFTEEEIFGFIDRFGKIIPQGGSMYGIGNTEQYITLSNCYVVEPPEDSYGGIHRTDEQITQISKRRGGTGTDISALRPSGSLTRNSSRTSTGPIPFAERFSNSIREVGQDGRRGALMLTMDVRHPSILEFIACKDNEDKITGANLSVRLSDDFMMAAMQGKQYTQQWPIDSLNPVISKSVEAKTVWDEIVYRAWKRAEPGVLFWDRIISESPADCYADFGFRTVSTNPCSELPLCVLDSCRLLLLNLFGFVVNPFTATAHFDWLEFYKYARIAQRLMDDIVDLELECIDRIITKINDDPESPTIKARELETWHMIREKCANGRRTGTGLTSLADVLAALGIKYGSDESIEFTDKVYMALKFACYQSSIEMAKEIGAFPIWNSELEKDNPFLNRIKNETLILSTEDFFIIPGAILDGSVLYEEMQKYGRRNIACLTTPPAGTSAIEAQSTAAIEPLYFMVSKRRKKGNPSDNGFRCDFVDANGDRWMEFEVFHPKLKMWMEITGETDITKSPWYGCCAEDLDYMQRVKLQATAQQHVDHAISSTINLPEDITVEQVKAIYETAWKLGCKGITVYRKNCRAGVILDVDTKKKPDTIKQEIQERPKVLPCDVHHIAVRNQQYFVLVGIKDGKPYEVFAGKNGFMPKKIKTGKIIRVRKDFYKATFNDSDVELAPITASTDEMEEVVTRLTSGLLRSGADMHLIVRQLEKVGERQSDLYCFSRSVARALKKYIPDGTEEKGEQCPECGQTLVRESGCITCRGCGWSKCL